MRSSAVVLLIAQVVLMDSTMLRANEPVPAPALGIQAQIDRAITGNVQSVRLAPGNYRLADQLQIRNAKNLTIDGTGVNLVFTVSNLQPLLIARCQNLTVKGLTIDFDPLPFVQGSVTRVTSAEGYIEVEVEDG